MYRENNKGIKTSYSEAKEAKGSEANNATNQPTNQHLGFSLVCVLEPRAVPWRFVLSVGRWNERTNNRTNRTKQSVSKRTKTNNKQQCSVSCPLWAGCCCKCPGAVAASLLRAVN